MPVLAWVIVAHLVFPIAWGIKEKWAPHQFISPLIEWLLGYGLILALIELMAFMLGRAIIQSVFVP